MNKELIKTLKSHSPEKIALVSDERQMPYGELLNKVVTLAAELKAHRIESLALYADNSIEWIVVDLACQLANIRIIPVPLFFSEEQIINLLKDCGGVSAMVTDRLEEAHKLVSVKKAGQLQSLALELLQVEQKFKVELPLNTAKITFTSGSSGNPKGVCLSVENQFITALSIADSLLVDESENDVTHLSLLPLTTLLENIAGVYAPLIRGGKIIIPSLKESGLLGSASVDAQKILATITKYQPNTLILVPELLMLLVTAMDMGWNAPASLKFIAVGGAKVSVDLLERAREKNLPVYEGYGLSECVSVVSLNLPEHEKTGSCGKALPHCEITVENRELVVKGNVHLGYVNDPASWYQQSIHTGDTGFIDDEGYVHIKGRIKNILVSSYGRNINPEWVESKLLASPLIKQAVIFGDAKPYCVALIHTRFEQTSDSEIQDLIDAINSSLPDYAHVKAWQRLHTPLSVEQGLLTENGRPKRKMIFSYYKKLIESIYKNTSKHHHFSEVA